MANLAVPTGMRATCDFDEQVARSVSESPFSFQYQQVLHGGRRWRAVMEIKPCTPALADTIDAWIYLLRDATNNAAFAAQDFNRPSGPSGTRAWRLTADSPGRLNRRQGGYGDATTLTFVEAI